MNEFRGPKEADGQRIKAIVKWFNRTKGFGFVAATDGSGDIFLSAGALSQAGYNEAGEGTGLVCDVIDGPKGRSVARIVEIDISTSPAPVGRAAGSGISYADRAPPPDRLNTAPSGPAEKLAGAVKWYDITRGFGFIEASDGGDDIFVHLSALRRSGLDMLVTGQTVRMLVQKSRRGREAATVELI